MAAFVIVVLLSVYVGIRTVQTLEMIQLLIKDLRNISADIQTAPRKLGAGFLGKTADVLQFIIGRR